MRSIDEFSRAARRATIRGISIPTAGLFAFQLAVVLAQWVGGPAIHAAAVRLVGERAAEALFFAAFFGGMVLILPGGLLAFDLRERRDPILNCPWCRRSLKDHAAQAIATRNCGHCGRRVFAEPAPVGAESAVIA